MPHLRLLTSTRNIPGSRSITSAVTCPAFPPNLLLPDLGNATNTLLGAHIPSSQQPGHHMSCGRASYTSPGPDPPPNPCLSPGLTEMPLTSLCFCSCPPPGSEFIQRPEPFKQHHLDHTTPSSKLSRAIPAPSVKSQVPTVASRSPLATPVSSHPATSQRAAPQAAPDLSLASGPFHVLFFCLECAPAHPIFPEWLTLVPPESGHLVEVTPSHTSPTSAFAAPVTT